MIRKGLKQGNGVIIPLRIFFCAVFLEEKVNTLLGSRLIPYMQGSPLIGSGDFGVPGESNLGQLDVKQVPSLLYDLSSPISEFLLLGRGTLKFCSRDLEASPKDILWQTRMVQSLNSVLRYQSG